MDIVVLLKRVPDTAARIAVGGDGTGMDPSGVEWVLSPYDEMALERAIQLKEAGVAAKVTVLTLGGKDAVKELRTALAMGADEAVLLLDTAPVRDSSGTAGALAAALADIPHDLVLAGWKAADTDAAAVPHYVAAELGIPCVTLAVKLEVEDGQVVVSREIDGTEVVVSAPLPCLVTAQKSLAEPRYTSLKGIMMAKRKPLAEKPAESAEPKISVIGMELPPARAGGKILGEGVETVPELIRALSEDEKVL